MTPRLVAFRLPGDPYRWATFNGVTTAVGDAALIEERSVEQDSVYAVAAAPLFTQAMRENGGIITVDVVDHATGHVVGALAMNVAGVVRFREVVR